MSLLWSRTSALVTRSSVFKEGRFMATAATDPIQKLFLEKLHEYNKKAASAPEGLVDCDNNLKAQLNDEIDRVYNSYGVKKGEEDKITTKHTDHAEIDDPQPWLDRPDGALF
ncbi:ATP synthase, coupling factor 6 [Brevipalpus obovatus]|uniref:ATP synthase, coupling factor 6 n=1 Tax=Brevipalpus obovatus TaxID=246614 RepID=UPI003D9F1594